MLYDIIYALAARDGREAALFGDCAPLAREAFARSLPDKGFPELWFELPLSGKPWFDLHALASQEHFDKDARFAPERFAGNSSAFAWFAAQEQDVRQLALSWDVSAGNLEDPAVQLLVSTADEQVTYDFLEAAGRPDAATPYRAFRKRLPREWFACYAGVFPRRLTPFLRVECIPTPELQKTYSTDATLLEEHLKQAGLTDFGDTLIPRCQALASAPFQLEFQFDIDKRGDTGNVFGVSARFAMPPGSDSQRPFELDGAAGELMQEIEQWGLADKRWRLLADTAFAKRASFEGKSCTIFCYPTFIKLRWRDGNPLDAKAYLMAGVQ